MQHALWARSIVIFIIIFVIIIIIQLFTPQNSVRIDESHIRYSNHWATRWLMTVGALLLLDSSHYCSVAQPLLVF